ncbi:hypothetical protein Krac_3824 [Ktedonobacter racemifer DSM 44963]|uniref:Uncharacterized protein n=1 Tax=Ktedonobacter racemifer DSM 44963 TaxID=485913 RepID=D6U324_KTERA|nr:hypothetical protein Krac_3824 [Ktedonobacter racemifer DSM 44963]
MLSSSILVSSQGESLINFTQLSLSRIVMPPAVIRSE